MAREPIDVSYTQKHALDTLCKRLFEMGYVVVEVDERFRRTPYDVIAVPKYSPSADSIIWIRPERDGSVCIRLYGGRSLGRKVKTAVEKSRTFTKVSLHWRQKPLFFISEKKAPWYERISPDGRETLKLLKVAFW